MPDNEQERPSNPKEVLANFGKTSTVGALPQYCSSYWIFFKLLWIVVFIVGMAATGIHIVSLCKTYYKYPMQVTVEVKTNETLQFPAITICNLNPIKYSAARTKNKECIESGAAEMLKLQEQFATGVISSKFLKNAYKDYVKKFKMDHSDEDEKPPKINVWARELLGMKDYNKCLDNIKEKQKKSDVHKDNEESTENDEEGEITEATKQQNKQSVKENKGKGKQKWGKEEEEWGIEDEDWGIEEDEDWGIEEKEDWGIEDENWGIEDEEDWGIEEEEDWGMEEKEDWGIEEKEDWGIEDEDWGIEDEDWGIEEEEDWGIEEAEDWRGIEEEEHGKKEWWDEDGADGEYEWENYFDKETHEYYENQEDYDDSNFEYYPEYEGEEGGFGDEESYLDFVSGAKSDKDFSRFMHKSRLDDLIDIKDLYLFDWSDIEDGTQASDFFLECTIDRARCSHKSFKKIINKRYGNCFVFNSAIYAGDNEDDRKAKPNRTRKSGRENGLRLTLDIQADEYMGLLADSYGIAVSIHDAYSQSLSEVDGFVVSPGVETKVSVKLKQIKRLQHPFKSNCTNDFPSHLKDYTIPDSHYTLRQCQWACLDYYLDTECNCVEQLDLFAVSEEDATRTCNVFAVDDRKCQALIHERLAMESGKNGSLHCDCAASCTDNLFEYSLSHATWPTDGYSRLKMAHFYGRDKRHHLATKLLEELVAHEQNDDNDFDDWIAQNLIRLHIYYESLTYEIVQEQEAYSQTQLISDIGGVVGLYLGMSLVTLVEVFQLILMLVFTGLKSKPKTRPTPDRR